MVDRGRSPIRPTPSPSKPEEGATDPVGHEDALDVETSSLAARELDQLIAQSQVDLRKKTVEMTAGELDVLLAQARPGSSPGLPPPRAPMTTQPYDEVTAYVLLDKDEASAEPIAIEPQVDAAPEIEAQLEAEATPRAASVLAESIVAPIPAAEPSAPASQSIPPAVPASSSSPASTPSPAAIPSAPARAKLPSGDLEWPGAKDRKRRTTMVISMVIAVASIAMLYLLLAEPAPPSPGSPTAPTVAAVTAPPPPAPTPSGPPPQSPAEIDARKALARLREGMGDCVRHAIGTLPGSSPAVPATMKQASGGGYTAQPADWKTAVWSCARFQHDTPMRFQLQWQSDKPGVEAIGLAWIDDDGDGDADRALGFSATAKGVRDVDLGEVAPVEMRPVLPVR